MSDTLKQMNQILKLTGQLYFSFFNNFLFGALPGLWRKCGHLVFVFFDELNDVKLQHIYLPIYSNYTMLCIL